MWTKFKLKELSEIIEVRLFFENVAPQRVLFAILSLPPKEIQTNFRNALGSLPNLPENYAWNVGIPSLYMFFFAKKNQIMPHSSPIRPSLKCA